MKRLAAFLACLAALPAAAATILVVNQDSPGEGLNDTTPAAPVGGNTGTNVGQQRLIVMQRAAGLWAQRLVSSVPIRVGANFNPLSCSDFSGVLGSAGPAIFHRDFAGAPRSGTFYPAALANALAGTDLSTTSVDMDAEFNSNLGQPGCLSSLQWYYGLDGNAPGNTIDFLGVVLHEYAHGLGFLSTVDLSTGAKLNGFNDPYIFNLEDHSTGKLFPNMTDAERVAASINAGNLHWVGTNATNNAGFLLAGRDPANGHIRMYAPGTVEPGSSVSHWDTALTPNELMEPFANPVTDRRLTEQLFRDIGWTVLPPIQTNGQAIVSETCPNGAIDPGETVTVNFTLKNAGFANVATITATLLATNGVTSPGGPQSFGALTNLGPGATRAFTFTATGVCGAAISPTFRVQDGATDYGLVSFFFRLGTPREFAGSNAISIPGSGAATPYPAAIVVSNFPGTVSGISVRLAGISHNNPDDLDVLLAGPGGQKVLLMSDCGGSPNLSAVTFTFTDAAPSALADSSQLASGTFKPSNYGTGDTFNPPAPASPYATSLSAFDGSDPNGTWQLFVMDDTNPTSGNIAGGWTLILPECCRPATNANPQITLAPVPTNYVENAAPLLLVPEAAVNDADNTDFQGGALTVAFATNGMAADQLGVLDTGGITAAAGTVAFQGTNFGAVSGGTNGTALVITFNSTNATPAVVQALVRAVAFANTSDTPATNARSVRFTVTDGAGGLGAATKLLGVIAVNDMPVISSITNRSTLEDVVTGPVSFVIGDAETSAGALDVSGTSSNAALVSALVFGGSGSNRTVNLQPATNETGTTLITLFVSDGAATNSTSFALTITPVNDPPTISALASQSVNEDEILGPLPFGIGDVETDANSLIVHATSTNTALVPIENILLGGPGSNRTVSVQPATNMGGTTFITILVSDGVATNSTGFLLTIAAVNDAPTIAPLSDQTITGRTNSIAIPIHIADADTPADALVVAGSSSNVTLVPAEGLAFGGSGSNRTLTIFPATNQTGASLITVEVRDGELTNHTTFLLTVLPVADLAVAGTMNWDGTNLLVNVAVSNAGPDTASAVVLSNLVPPGATVLSVNSEAATCDTTNGAAVCQWPFLAAGTSAVATVTLVISPPGWFTNQVLVSAADYDPEPANNSATLVLAVAGLGDFDGDGMTDQWEFANGTNPLLADGAEDPDRDGLNNLQEFLAGTNPQSAESVLRITTLGIEPGTNALAIHFLAVSNRTYSILGTTNPATGPWERIVDVPASVTGVLSVTNPPAPDAMRFFRVVTPSAP
jgi:subtilisin-like proprotein convertase family protein